jgi:hypothetical protein
MCSGPTGGQSCASDCAKAPQRRNRAGHQHRQRHRPGPSTSRYRPPPQQNSARGAPPATRRAERERRGGPRVRGTARGVRGQRGRARTRRGRARSYASPGSTALPSSASSTLSTASSMSRQRSSTSGALLAHFDGSVDVHLYEAQAVALVRLAREPARLRVGRDDGDERDQPGIGEQACDLSGAPHVAVAVLGGEAEIAADAVAQVVPVEPVGGSARAHQVGLNRGRDGRLAGRREAREPHGRPPLADRFPPLRALDDPRVPGHVGARRHAEIVP